MKGKSLSVSLHLSIFIALLTLGVMGTALPQTAQAVECGDIIDSPDNTVTLDGDVGPCDDDDDANTMEDAALTVVGPTRLDLDGFTVSCADTNNNGELSNGILIIGASARVRNGAAVGCDDGLRLGTNPPDAGDGGHKVTDVLSTGHEGDCFDFNSGSNTFKDNTGIGCGDDGYDVDSSGNVLKDNTADGAGDNGFSVNGAKNIMVGNEALGNADRGMDFDGDVNIVVENTLRGNGLEGIRLDDGNFVILKNNTVIDNGRDGIEVESDRNIIWENVVQGNGEVGILVEDTGNNNTIRENTALENKVDLQDDNPNCDNNVWRDNRFTTSSTVPETAGCIQ